MAKHGQRYVVENSRSAKIAKSIAESGAFVLKSNLDSFTASEKKLVNLEEAMPNDSNNITGTKTRCSGAGKLKTRIVNIVGSNRVAPMITNALPKVSESQFACSKDAKSNICPKPNTLVTTKHNSAKLVMNGGIASATATSATKMAINWKWDPVIFESSQMVILKDKNKANERGNAKIVNAIASEIIAADNSNNGYLACKSTM